MRVVWILRVCMAPEPGKVRVGIAIDGKVIAEIHLRTALCKCFGSKV